MISIIIPTLDEAEALPGLLRALAREEDAHEVIVADGGSADATLDIARTAGARIVSAPRGRGGQIAAGAAVANGEMLWFLHADTAVPSGVLNALRRALADGVAGGNFRLLFEGAGRFDRFMNIFYAALRRVGWYYGDSGIFVRRDVYDAVGGMRAIALMEDYDFVRRMRRAGRTVCVRLPPLTTSSRRFVGRNPLSIVAGWIAIHLFFRLGASPQFLARLYRSTVHAPGLEARRSAPNHTRSGRSR